MTWDGLNLMLGAACTETVSWTSASSSRPRSPFIAQKPAARSALSYLPAVKPRAIAACYVYQRALRLFVSRSPA